MLEEKGNCAYLDDYMIIAKQENPLIINTIKASMSVIGFVSVAFASIIVAEALIITAGALAGTVIYGLILTGVLNLYYFSRKPADRQVYLSLSLVPLLRLLSLAIGVPRVPHILWYATIGAPLLLACVLAYRINGLPALEIRMSWRNWAVQGLFGLIGIPLGILAYRVFKPAALVSNAHWTTIVTAAVVLVLFSSLTEELLFRGFIQKVSTYVFGGVGVVFTSILYASMFLGTLSVIAILFFGLLGLLFSIWVQTTRSLWGVIITHSLLNILFFIVMPLSRMKH